MSESLRDQLLKAGFKPTARPERDGAAGGRQRVDGAMAGNRAGEREPSLAEAYAARQREERKAAEEARQRALAEQQRRRENDRRLQALVGSHAQNRPEAELARHFEYGKRIRRVYVTAEQMRALNAGELGVVQWHGRFYLLPADRIEEVLGFAPEHVALRVDPTAPSPEPEYEDPRHRIPDDLMW
jgi:uncharacterized protein YaiL (DUF2058 family)